jgi:Trypsin-like peptidase domain
MRTNMVLFFSAFFYLPFFGSNAYALNSVKDSVVVLNDSQIGFPKGNFCSGFIVEHNKKQYLITASHCFPKPEILKQIRLVQGYTPEVVEAYFLTKLSPTSSKPDSVKKLEAQLAALDLESRDLNEEAILQSDRLKVVRLGSPLILNRTIDLAVFSLPMNSTLKSIKLNSQVSDLSTAGALELELFGHPKGQSFRMSQVCEGGNNDPLSDDFLLNTNCPSEGGNSGGPVTLFGTDKVIGIHLGIHEKKDRDGLVINRLSKYALYFPSVARAILEMLNGNLEVGIQSEKKKYWLSLDGSLKLRLRLDLDELNAFEQLEFYKVTSSLVNLVKEDSHGDELSAYSMVIYKTAPEGQANERALYLGATAEVISQKFDQWLSFLFGK